MTRTAILGLLTTICVAGAAHADAAKGVEDALIVAEPKLHRCWEQAAADDYRVEGKIDLSITVAAGGKAGAVAVAHDGIGKAALAACVSGVFKSADFGREFVAGDKVEIPVEFKAEPNFTIRAADVTPVDGVKFLVDTQASGPSAQATLVLATLPKNRRLASAGMAVVRLDTGDALFLPIGATNFASGTESLLLYVPAIGSRKLPVVNHDAAAGGRGAALARAKEYPILDGKGGARILIEESKLAVTRLGMLPGVTVPEHVHADSDEILYVVAGGGEMTIEGAKYPVEPGMAIYVPAGAKHSFTSAGASFDAVQFYVPGGPEQRFKGPKK